MCHFIAVGVKPGSSGEVEEQINYKLVPAPDYVRALFPSGQEVLIVNVGVCACDFFSDPLDEEEEARIRAYGRKRGWSQTKIDRSVGQRGQVGGLDLEIVRRIGNAARVGVMSVLVFWDEGTVMPKGEPISVPADRLVAERLSIRADRLVLLS